MKALLADLTSGDDARAEKSILPLVELGQVAIGPLIELTHSNNADIRWWAVRALAASPHTQTLNLIPLLNDSSSSVRAATVLAILNHPHEDAIEALIQALYDEDPLTAGLAGNALVKIGSPTTPSLLKVMEEAQTNVRIIAIRALAEIKDHRAIPTMMKCLNDENESAVIQYWAVQGLNKLGLDMVYINP
ncbi:MAG: HEAT repeat domain-containing protein [Anaerolineales bacterium]|nr:HEAT repeat domain-containing protein [Anaerolineales bacterium]